MEFVSPGKANQHLNQYGERTTLCGQWFEHLTKPAVWDHRDGFHPNYGTACAKCADAADRIQNGMR